MQVPRLPVTGENFKKYAIDTLKAIIAYLHASRVRPGKGIRVEETPCGTVISIIPRGSAIQGGAGGITYEAGTGITITGGTPGVPEKINANITGGNDISVTGGTNGNPLVISYTGGGGGGGDVGIDSMVSGGTATVYLDGGTGSVVFTGENGITISGGTFGEIIISGGTGGGGGGGEDDAVFISEEPSDATGQIAAQTNKRYYIAVFGDLHHDEDYGYVCQYYLTYDYSTSPPTITRHKTDYTDLSDYGNGYSLELVLPAPSEDRFIDLCLFAFTTILISSSKPIYNYQGSPILQPYPIENRNVKLVYIANDNGGRWYIYNN